MKLKCSKKSVFYNNSLANAFSLASGLILRPSDTLSLFTAEESASLSDKEWILAGSLPTARTHVPCEPLASVELSSDTDISLLRTLLSVVWLVDMAAGGSSVT